MKFIFVIAISLMVILISCSENISTECDPEINLPPSGDFITYSYIQENIFNTSCSNSGCHGGTNIQAQLNLTPSESYQNLLGVKSLLNPNFQRVVAGKSQDSFLIKMLQNSGNGTSQMPPSGKLENSLIDSVSAWIDRGAKND